MSAREAVILQKPDSSLTHLLEQAVTRQWGANLWRAAGPPLPHVTLGGEGLVIWDLTGFDPGEVAALALVLAQGDAGVVVACLEVDEAVRQVLQATQALGLLASPASPGAVAAALEVALNTRRRLWDLAGERESLMRQLAEREVIERAKRVLMAGLGLSESQAMRQMQKHARDNNLRLVTVAERLIATYHVFNGVGEGEKGREE